MKAQTPRLLKGSKIEMVSDGTVFTLMKEDPTHPGWDKALTDVFDIETKITATYKARFLPRIRKIVRTMQRSHSRPTAELLKLQALFGAKVEE